MADYRNVSGSKQRYREKEVKTMWFKSNREKGGKEIMAEPKAVEVEQVKDELPVGQVPVERLGEVSADVIRLLLATLNAWPRKNEDGTISFVTYGCYRCSTTRAKLGGSGASGPATCPVNTHFGDTVCATKFKWDGIVRPSKTVDYLLTFYQKIHGVDEESHKDALISKRYT